VLKKIKGKNKIGIANRCRKKILKAAELQKDKYLKEIRAK